MISSACPASHGFNWRVVVFVCIVFRVAPLVGGARIPLLCAGFAGVLWCFLVVVHCLVDLLLVNKSGRFEKLPRC